MSSPLMELRDLEVKYRGHVGLRAADGFTAVVGLSLSIAAGEAIAIVGESGAGKSSAARCMAGLQVPTSGELLFDGAPLDPRRDRRQRRRIQMVFQDPYSSLNPRRTVGSILTEVLRVNRVVDASAAERRACDLLEMVGLSADHLQRRPKALSGGQRQRVGIARALALEPDFLIADEPVSALDVSVQASVLRLIGELRRDLGLTLVLISHDLGVVRELCERVVVMRCGEVVEDGAVADVFGAPKHPYTAELLAASVQLPPVVDVFSADVSTGAIHSRS